ncbi:MFS transporter [Tepidamorphus sp. 3E244]|uniref:MFS transporter n=1 Tax=Tepidamorphus sp. 3E244 TaxID=3385498 RepID=UPI0038FC5AF5
MTTSAEQSGETRDAVKVTAGMVASLVGALAAVYFVSQFLRNSIGVIAPDLERELGIGPESLGLLSSVFFFGFALIQIPLGVLIDRYGPKEVMLGSLLLASIGCVVFAMSETMTGLVLARVLMGLGCSSFFMGPLTIFARWFARNRFSTLVGVQLGLGSLGTLFATAPLAFGADTIGWRSSFVVVAVATLAIGLVAAIIVRNDPPGTQKPPAKPASLGSAVAGLKDVLAVPGVYRLLAMHFVSYSTFATVAGLWGGPYLADIYGHDLQQRGFYLFLLAAGQIAGLFIWGPLDRLFGGPKKPAIVGALMAIGMLLFLALSGPLPAWALGPALAVFGFSCAFTPLVTSHGRLLFPAELVGRGITFLNIGTMGGVFLQQFFTGFIVAAIAGDAASRPFAAYSSVFLCVAGALGLALVFYLRAPDGSLDAD